MIHIRYMEDKIINIGIHVFWFTVCIGISYIYLGSVSILIMMYTQYHQFFKIYLSVIIDYASFKTWKTGRYMNQ